MAEKLRLLTDSTRTPIGELVLACDERGRLRAVDWKNFAERMKRRLRIQYGANGYSLERSKDPFGLTSVLTRYMQGDIAAIEALAVETTGTPFQRKVWGALRKIPAGTTTSYGALAKRIGHPTAVRAVGLANGANPVGIVVPCHRVIGANGTLTGYGGGLERKKWLLEHEARSGGAEVATR
jgi:methylated-DNA-[protein]-cysteine S-methyltransferase